MGRCIAIHLSIDKAARSGAIAGSRPFQGDTIRPNWLQGLAALPAPTHVAGQPHSAQIRRSRTTPEVGVSHAVLPVRCLPERLRQNNGGRL